MQNLNYRRKEIMDKMRESNRKYEEDMKQIDEEEKAMVKQWEEEKAMVKESLYKKINWYVGIHRPTLIPKLCHSKGLH